MMTQKLYMPLMVAILICLNASTAAAHNTFMNVQAWFTDNKGVRVIIPSGIAPRALQSKSSYAKYIRDGIEHKFGKVGSIHWNHGHDGSAVAIQMAVPDNAYIVWEFSPKPKPTPPKKSEPPPPPPPPPPPVPEGLVARWLVLPHERDADRDNRQVTLANGQRAEIVVHLPKTARENFRFNLKHHKANAKDQGRTQRIGHGSIVDGSTHNWRGFGKRIYLGDRRKSDRQGFKESPGGFYVDLVLVK